MHKKIHIKLFKNLSNKLDTLSLYYTAIINTISSSSKFKYDVIIDGKNI